MLFETTICITNPTCQCITALVKVAGFSPSGLASKPSPSHSCDNRFFQYTSLDGRCIGECWGTPHASSFSLVIQSWYLSRDAQEFEIFVSTITTFSLTPDELCLLKDGH
jgi:hypothetical protein